MKTLKKIAAASLVFSYLLLFGAGLAMAAGAPVTSGSNGSGTAVTNSTNCSDSSTAGINKCLRQNQIVKDLNVIVNVLSGGVGIVVIGMIITGGIQYSMAGDNPQATGAAKQRIMNALIALTAFIFLYAFLQWLIPGGVFG